MTASLETRYAMLTDVGRVRANNEDACGADPETGSYVVCDGMGGAAGGEIASRETAAAFLAEARERSVNGMVAQDLREAVSAANRTVYSMATRDRRLRGMGTTLVALQTVPQRGTLWVAHVGDSRCYRIRSGSIQRLTDDHSVVQEQLRNGEITEQEARRSHLRNVITRVVGSQREVEPESAEHPCCAGDLFLLCTDGLNRDLSDADILSIVERHRGNLDHVARVLVDAANLLGGGDNITVLLLEILNCSHPGTAQGSEDANLRNSARKPADRITRMTSILQPESSPEHRGLKESCALSPAACEAESHAAHLNKRTGDKTHGRGALL